MTVEATTNKNIKLTRQEKRVLNDLGYYTCFGLNYPIEKMRKIIKLWILVFIASLPLLFVHILIPFLYFFSMVLVLYIGDKKKYFNSPDITYRNRYIREYNLLKQENPSLTVEAFAESIKVFLAAQEKQRTQQEKWGAEQERAELKQKYDL